MDETAGSVLDASALLTYPQGEPGSQTVQAAGVPGSGASALSYWNSDGGLAPSARPMR